MALAVPLRGRRHESGVAQLFSLGHIHVYEKVCNRFGLDFVRRARLFIFASASSLSVIYAHFITRQIS